MNPYPTKNEEAALRDVLKHPDDSLADRAARLDVSRGGVRHLLERAKLKGFAQSVVGGSWVVTLAGRRWLRPTMATRQACR
jgi:predicted DNA-binding protein (UPF0251 family)